MSESTTFFSTMDAWHQELLQALSEINQDKNTKLENAEYAIILIDESIRKVKDYVHKYTFESVAEEIKFFKTRKPLFISEYLYYYQILTLESTKPVSSPKNYKKFLENEIAKLHNFHQQNEDFFTYYKRNAGYLDHKYFARNSYDLKMHLPFNLYNLDEAFTTSHDQYISAYIASNRILDELNAELANLNNPIKPAPQKNTTLEWIASKADLVELIYALHHSKAITSTNKDLATLIKAFESFFNRDLSNFHKVLVEIKGRKKERTKFTQKLALNLNEIFIQSDA